MVPVSRSSRADCAVVASSGETLAGGALGPAGGVLGPGKVLGRALCPETLCCPKALCPGAYVIGAVGPEREAFAALGGRGMAGTEGAARAGLGAGAGGGGPSTGNAKPQAGQTVTPAATWEEQIPHSLMLRNVSE